MLQYIVNGLTLGSVYALFAVSFSLIFGVLDVLNLAMVSLFTLSTYLVMFAVADGIPILLAGAGAAILCGALGVFMDQSVLKPLARRRNAGLQTLVAAIGLGSVLDAVILGVGGPDPQAIAAEAMPSQVFRPFGVTLTLAQMCGVVATVVTMAALAYALKATAWGRRVRATAENPFGAQVAGVNVEGTRRSTVFVSSVLAGLSGMLFVLQFNTLTPDLGHAVELKGLAAIIIGGMTSVTGAAAGGLLLGLVEVGTTVGLGAGWKDIAAFGAIFVVLLARPKGLFGVRAAREV